MPLLYSNNAEIFRNKMEQQRKIQNSCGTCRKKHSSIEKKKTNRAWSKRNFTFICLQEVKPPGNFGVHDSVTVILL